MPVVPELRVEATVDAYPGAQPVEQTERAEVDELLSWLSDADLPDEPFQLWPWQRVVDVGRLIVTLQTELSSDVIGPRWRGAAEELRQVARLYRGADREQYPDGNINRRTLRPVVVCGSHALHQVATCLYQCRIRRQEWLSPYTGMDQVVGARGG